MITELNILSVSTGWVSGIFIILLLTNGDRYFPKYAVVYTYFLACNIIFKFWTNIFELQTDVYSYVKASNNLAKESIPYILTYPFQKFNIQSIGPEVYESLLALFFKTVPAGIGFHVSIHVLISTIAILYGEKSATMLLGKNLSKFVPLGFVVYFSWYWHTGTFLREPIILALYAVFIYRMCVWYIKGSNKSILAATLAAIGVFILRPETFPILLIMVSVTVLGNVEIRFVEVVKSALLFWGLIAVVLHIIPWILGGDVFQFINSWRRATTDTPGVKMQYERVTSYWELFFDIPNHLIFWLIPISPWDIASGAKYLRAYLYSVTSCVIVGLSAYGYLRLRVVITSQKRRSLIYAFAVGALFFAIGASLTELTAGVSSRHSIMLHYVLLIIFVPFSISKIFRVLLHGKRI